MTGRAEGAAVLGAGVKVIGIRGKCGALGAETALLSEQAIERHQSQPMAHSESKRIAPDLILRLKGQRGEERAAAPSLGECSEDGLLIAIRCIEVTPE